MKTQISRYSFRPKLRYSGIYQQMGRMLTDADWNELSTIGRERLADALVDVIGSGTPRGRGMVHIEQLPDGSDEYSLRWGYVYVDGIIAQVRPDPEAVGADPVSMSIEHQADFPLAPVPAGDHRLYLDVWERTVTPREDSGLIDPGLNGADTCTRTQTMAQVKWCDTGVDPADAAQNPPIGDALLQLEVRQGSTETDECDPCSDELALQDEVGNSLFRVEVHDVVYDGSGAPERVTLKWSGENGAEQYAVDSLPTGFTGADWAFEFHHGPAEQMASEKHLGRHLATGFTPERGALNNGYPDPAIAGYSLVRRWDGYCELEKVGGNWNLVGGADRGVALSTASDASAHGHVDEGSTVVLQLDRLVLTLELADHQVLAGDFWWAPVRSAVHAPGDLLEMDLLPAGIRHHYMCLGDVVDGVFQPCDVGACKHLAFPQLTDLRADDVCFENTLCNMPGVSTVQDAINHLCQERDLPWHNKHLHGWGIVCGLVLECGSQLELDEEGPCPGEPFVGGGAGEVIDIERMIRVTGGYALDCEGRDLVLEKNCGIDLIGKIEAYEETHETKLLDDGNGSVCLWLDRGDDGKPVVRVEPYTKEKFSYSSLIDGTLWMDFYQDCIVKLIEVLTAELSFLDAGDLEKADVAEDALISLQRRKYISVINLVIQLFNPQNGSWVYLSEKEHLILLDFYKQLRKLLASQTFCALFEDNEFPPYPFPEQGKTTFFGKGFHTRVKLQPGGQRLYTYGGTDNRINVYETKKGELIEVLEMSAPEGSEVKALCFSPDGKLLYAAAQIKGLDTQLSMAVIRNDRHEWLGSTVLCDLLITEMEPDVKGRGLIYAIGLGKGLYYLHPEILFDATEKPRPQPIYAFNACGHLRVDATRAFATSRGKGNGSLTRYDEIVLLNLDLGSPDSIDLPPTQRVSLRSVSGNAVSGDDDIAVGQTEKGNFLYVVVDEAEGGEKRLLTYRYGPDGLGSGPSSELPTHTDSATALEFHPKRAELITTMEEHYLLFRVDFSGKELVTPFVPVQIQPTDVAVDSESGRVYVLNFASNTITAIPGNEIAVGSSYVNTLIEYRNAVLEAFFALFGGLLQYLKDCFCHHLLVKCPQCSEDDVIYLGVAEIRDNQVYKVCNFEKRKYVKSFPTVDYWLSIIPVMPLVKQAVNWFCCSSIPKLFSGLFDSFKGSTRDDVSVAQMEKNRFRGKDARRYIHGYQRTDFKALARDQTRGLEFLGSMAADGAIGLAQARGKAGIKKQALMGAEVSDAERELKIHRIDVDKVVDYDPDLAGDNLKRYTSTPQRIEPGSKVTLFQKDGKVLFYSVAQPLNTIDQAGPAELEVLEAKKTEMKSEVDRLARRIGELESKRQQELEQTDALEARRQAIRDDMQAMNAEMTRMETMRKELRIAVDKERPVNDLGGVDEDIVAKLRERGIRTIEDLADARPDTLAREIGVNRNRLREIVSAAKTRIGRNE